MSEKCWKCLKPFYAVYCDCTYVDLFGRCAASKKQRDFCKSYMNEKMEKLMTGGLSQDEALNVLINASLNSKVIDDVN